MNERPCSCADRHREFAPHPLGGTQIVPVQHQHEDERCSERYLGVDGCPGLPHCRDWILGAYEAGATLAEVTGDKQSAWETRQQCAELEREFARRSLIAQPTEPYGSRTRARASDKGQHAAWQR